MRTRSANFAAGAKYERTFEIFVSFVAKTVFVAFVAR
jgi:hypothetical protein